MRPVRRSVSLQEPARRSAVARFPVPWTPARLVAALTAAELLPDRPMGRLTRRGQSDDRDEARPLSWGDRVVGVSATRDPATGGWVVRATERGTEWTAYRAVDDAALCDYLMDQVAGHPYPYGSFVEPALMSAVRPAVPRARAWWAQHAQLPYLETERATGAA